MPPSEITDKMVEDFRTRIHASNAACLSATEIRTGLAAVFTAHVWPELATTIDADGWERETEPRTLREILFTHRALAGASSIDVTDLMNQLQPLMGGTQVTDELVTAFYKGWSSTATAGNYDAVRNGLAAALLAMGKQ